MTTNARTAHATVPELDFDEIERALARGRRLRAQAFGSMVAKLHRLLTGRRRASRPVLPVGLRDCATTT